MMASTLYHEGNRALQDAFDSRRIADRLESVTLHTAFTERDRRFIEGLRYFFLATADADGRPAGQVLSVEVVSAADIAHRVLFDPGHGLEERLIREQFV